MNQGNTMRNPPSEKIGGGEGGGVPWQHNKIENKWKANLKKSESFEVKMEENGKQFGNKAWKQNKKNCFLNRMEIGANSPWETRTRGYYTGVTVVHKNTATNPAEWP